MSEPVSSATIGERVVTTTLASGGLTLPIWIQYFKEYAQIGITACYLIVAIIALVKSIKSLKGKNGRKKQTDR